MIRVASKSSADDRDIFFFTIGLFIALLGFGGGGAPAPFIQSLLHALGWIGLLFLVWRHFFVRPLASELRWSGLFLLVILLLPVAQLVPLPYGLWQDLPGHALPARTLETAGIAPHARPLSLDPESTRFAALALLPGAFIFIATASIDHVRRRFLVKIVLGVALVSAIVGVAQFASPGSRSLYLFPRAIFNQASGLFANRNFQSDLMLIGILLSAFLVRVEPGQVRFAFGKRKGRIHLAAFLVPFFALMVLSTSSRAGALLLGPVLIIALFTAFGAKIRSRTLIGIGAIALVVAATLLAGTQFTSELVERVKLFDLNEEVRVAALPDILYAINGYFPFGSGLGTFDPVYRSVESLTLVRDKYLNHAHNDYLEIILETGIFGIALAIGFILALVVRAWQVWRADGSSSRVVHQRVATVGIAILLLHSTGDYPLRTTTLLSIFAFLCAVLFTSGRRIADDAGKEEGPAQAAPAASGGYRSPKRRGPPGKVRALRAMAALAILAGGAWTSLTIVRIGLARQAVQADLGSLAYQLRPSNARGTALMANLALVAGDTQAAIALARQAIDASPIDVVAVRTLGDAQGRVRPGAGDPAMLIAAQLSWRDAPTQAWVLERALLAGESVVAMERAEALARRRPDNPVVFSMVRLLALEPAGRRQLVAALVRQPAWRTYFFNDATVKTLPQLLALAEVLETLKRTPAPPSVREARPAIDELIQAGEVARAWQLYSRLFLGGARGGALWLDGNFERPGVNYQPFDANTAFDWRAVAAGQSQAGVEPELEQGANHVLYAMSDSDGPAALVSRLTALPPGRYRLRYRVKAPGREGPAGFRWVVLCRAGGTLMEYSGPPLSGSGWEQQQAEFTVPAANCTSQSIALMTNPRATSAQREAQYDDVVIASVGG